MAWFRKVSTWKVTLFLLCFLLLGFVIYSLSVPLVSNTFCTMADCLRSEITVIFSGNQKPASYKIEVDSPAGKQILICPENEYSGKPDRQYINVSECFSGGGRLPYKFDYPVEQVSVTLYVNGYKLTKTLTSSNCQSEGPNGKGCLPTCCRATVEFDPSP
jgi:hypothetical protein